MKGRIGKLPEFTIKRKVALVPAVMASGAGLLFAGTLVFDGVSSEEPEEAVISVSPALTYELVDVFEPTPVGPTFFVGEKLGIQFGPEDEVTPREVPETECPSHAQITSWMVQGESNLLPAPRHLPEGATMPPTKRTFPQDVPNPGVMVCPATGQELGALRYYELPTLPSGFTPNIFISRDVRRAYTSAPYRLSELEEIDLSGHTVIRIVNAENNGGPHPASAIFLFAEDGGLVSLVTTGLVLDEATRVAQSFVEAFAAAESQ